MNECNECGIETEDIVECHECGFFCVPCYDKNPDNFSEFKKYLSCTSGNLMETAAWIVGERDAHVLSLSNKVGVAWGLIGTLRALRYHISLKKISLPQDLLDQHGVSKKTKKN